MHIWDNVIIMSNLSQKNKNVIVHNKVNIETKTSTSNKIVVGGGGSPFGMFSPFVSVIVVMNTFFMFATSFLDQASFCNTTFQPGFLMSFGKTLALLDKEI
jgi:hypothetical protein